MLREGQAIGLVGPGDVGKAVRHAEGFAAALGENGFAGRALDLGSGGGLPGLALALRWPESHWVLLDSRHKATEFLARAIESLQLTARVQVLEDRAEVVGRSDRRGSFHLVVARGFGPPAVTAECAAPLLRSGGQLIVSEPPSPGDRWPVDGLALLGLRPVRATEALGAHYELLVQDEACPARFPRRTGVPARRPLF